MKEKVRDFLENLDEVSVPARYPDELEKLLKVYDKKRTQDFLKDRRLKIHKVIFFGSYATKDFNSDSDVDIAIIFRRVESFTIIDC